MTKSVTPTRALSFVVILLYGNLLAAAENQTEEQKELPGSESASNPTTAIQEIEEITVIGERSLLSMRYEIVREEDLLYRLFNELNSDDKFDIRCSRRSNTRSLIRQRSCEPKFLKQHRQSSNRHAMAGMREAFGEEGLNTALFQNGLDRLEPESEIQAQLAGDYEEMNEEIFRIAMENPDYLAVLLKISRLSADYRAAREAKFGPD